MPYCNAVGSLSLLLVYPAWSTNQVSDRAVSTSHRIQVDSSGRSQLIRRSDLSDHAVEHPHVAKKEPQSVSQAGKIEWTSTTGFKPAELEICLMAGYGYDPSLIGATQGSWKGGFSYYFNDLDECRKFCFGNPKCQGFTQETPGTPDLPWCTFLSTSAFSQPLVPAEDGSVNTYEIKVTPTVYQNVDVQLNLVVGKTFNSSNLCYFPDVVPCDNQWSADGSRFYYTNQQDCTTICRETPTCVGYVNRWNYTVKFCEFKSCYCDTLDVSDGRDFYLLPLSGERP